MRKLIKRAAALLGAASLSALGLVGFYGKELPDFYYLAKGDRLSLGSSFAVTVGDRSPSRGDDGMTVNSAAFGGSGLGGDSLTEHTLMLFGAIPIKNVTAGTVERPMLMPCGQPFGIKLMTDGVMVIGLEDIGSSCPASQSGIMVGDVITEIDGQAVTGNRSVSEIISSTGGEPCSVSYSRSGRKHKTTLTPVYSGGTYKAGMWVRDSSAGIGTLTFYDPSTGVFGGLGHPICDADTKLPVPISHGTVGEVNITGCVKSEHGDPGQLLGEFSSKQASGEITKNISEGIFGILDRCPAEGDLLPLAMKQEVHTGPAVIYSTLEGDRPCEYTVEIVSIDLSEDGEHDMIVQVTDDRLLEDAGGIVRGMSGSPIIQDGMLAGAVTHVFIDDPTRGYGIFAEDMYCSSR